MLDSLLAMYNSCYHYSQHNIILMLILFSREDRAIGGGGKAATVLGVGRR